MFLLDDPPEALDRSKLLKEILVKPDYLLLLTRRPGHVQTPRDRNVATSLAVYTGVLFLIAMWLLVSVWPKTQLEYNLTMARTVSIFGTATSYSLGPETLLLIVMIFSGVVGACIFSAFAISHHLGQYKDFDKSWTAWYLLRPLIGAGLAVVINLLLRSSLFTVGSGSQSLNIVGLSGVAALAGVFSEEAIKKLNEIADAMFGKVAKKPSKQDSPSSIS